MTFKWTKQADIFAYCMYKINKYDSKTLEKVSDFLKCKPGSLKMRIKNYEFLDTKTTGLSNYAKLSKIVYLELNNNPDIFEKICKNFINQFCL